ncbi:type VI secretion protein IcmF/TssM N-terminal domain-containing protein [Pandoraea pulmonicola]|uniref:type VI secretion protein IcmF/TssM N-terminal domain-containing protein n=1 Tax=Pandoraea pulmonicola TaxID=93221 RepID=UPI001359D494|nr:type VI secretion protein IcmF/TssM N-terminal domain-containing protein [Pandoraea pulmonicola]
MKNFAKGALWVVLLLILLLACWLTALYLGWSAWSGLLLLCGVLAGAWCVRRAWRMWKTWRPHRKLACESAAAAPVRDTARVDIAWRRGVRLLGNLRNSRLPRWDSVLYALPWIMVMGAAGSGKSTLLTRSRLSSALRPVNQHDPVPPTNALDWWYFDHSVILEPAGNIVDAADPAHEQADWRRLLDRMSRTRRREPLNGIVLTLPAGELLQADPQQLADAGRAMRSRIDALSRIYEAHIPIWIVLTQCDKIPGFVAWGRELPAAMLDTALGVEIQAANATDFVAQAFAGINRRLGEVRLEQSSSCGSDSDALFFPEHAAAMAAPLEAYLAPAFDENPYGETPWLKGIYLTAEVMPEASDAIESAEGPDTSGIRETRTISETAPNGAAQALERAEGAWEGASVPWGWFSKDLFSVVLPAQRDAYRPYTRNGLWRRFARHGLVVSWLALCGLSAVLLTWGYLDARQVITAVSARHQQKLDFSGDLASRLRELSELDTTNRMLETHESLGLYRWLPYHWQVNRVAHHFQRGFSDDFQRHALVQGVDQMMTPQLATLSTSADDTMVAAYAQHYVRRINALDAAMTQRPQGDAPLPGSELQAISLHLDPLTPYDPMMASRFATLYGDYVRWQPDKGALRAERDSLRARLAQLGIASRSTSWLAAWANLQGDLTPVTLASFWDIPDRPELPRVSRAYTPDGRRAVSGFIDELARAAGDDPQLKTQPVTLARRYREQLRDTWLRFATDFANSRRYLIGEQQWRDAFALILTSHDPYLRVIHEIATTFPDSLGGGGAAPDWAQLAARLDSLIASSNASDGSLEQRSAALFSLANAVGTDAVRAIGSQGAGSIAQRLRGSTALAQELGVYHDQLAAAIQIMRQGDGHALKLTADTYAYGSDPSIQSAPLHTAAEAMDAMKKSDDIAVHPADLSIWNLLRGPLDFVLDYGGHVSACALQKDWDAQVLAPLQGVSSQQMSAALYGDAGVVPAFMAGTVKPFVERDATQYRPRQTQGQSIPLNGTFYAFVSQAQRAHAGVQQARQTAEAQAAELPALEQQINEVSAKLDALKATVGIVKLTAQPAEVNPGAKVLPEQSSLTLQCTGGETTLDNYNFPSSKSFNWSLATCGDVTLDVRLPGVELTRHWRGARAFIDFLRASADGQYTFDLSNYPNEQKTLAASRVEWVKLKYQQQGQGALLASFDEVDRLTKLLKTLTDRRAALQGATVSGAPDNAPSPGALYAVPREISACWIDTVPAQVTKGASAALPRTSRNTAPVAK